LFSLSLISMETPMALAISVAVDRARDNGPEYTEQAEKEFASSPASAFACAKPFSLSGKSLRPRKRPSLFPLHSPCRTRIMVVLFAFMDKPPLQDLRITIPSYLKLPDR
jgi:hypothetical protein